MSAISIHVFRSVSMILCSIKLVKVLLILVYILCGVALGKIPCCEDKQKKIEEKKLYNVMCPINSVSRTLCSI